MKRGMPVGIVYGSSTGNTRDVAVKLHAILGGDLHDVTEIDAETIGRYDKLVFATSTWGAGDLQDDWEAFLPTLDAIDFAGKRVGILGLGDQEHYPDIFADAMAILADKVEERGGRIVGLTATDGYTYERSRAVRKGRFLGLAVDEDSQSGRTDERLHGWAEQLRREFA